MTQQVRQQTVALYACTSGTLIGRGGRVLLVGGFIVVVRFPVGRGLGRIKGRFPLPLPFPLPNLPFSLPSLLPDGFLPFFPFGFLLLSNASSTSFSTRSVSFKSCSGALSWSSWDSCSGFGRA